MLVKLIGQLFTCWNLTEPPGPRACGQVPGFLSQSTPCFQGSETIGNNKIPASASYIKSAHIEVSFAVHVLIILSEETRYPRPSESWSLGVVCYISVLGLVSIVVDAYMSITKRNRVKVIDAHMYNHQEICS